MKDKIDQIGNKRKGKTFEQRFVDELNRQCDGKDIAIMNKVLRERLGWMDDNFDKIRNSLIKKGIVKAAPGQGGKTKFVNYSNIRVSKKLFKIFISYSHVDEILKNKLLQHLKPLERINLIEIWSDLKIKPGEKIDPVISKEIDNADIVLLLVSVDFINSEYCNNIELERAIENHNSGKSRVIPIILRNCLWKHSPFGGLSSLPKDAKAVVSWGDQDEAFTNTVNAIHELINDMLEC
ncbi:MAG: toll/interleukin-1 receptor domain-containing protein [Zavarzinia sp.]|nr:toll/interleukin-1 receptor domain-containing protein [Zavarzinia sp.]